MTKIKVVSFDLDGTILQREFDYELWYDKLHRFVARAKGIGFKEAYDMSVSHAGTLPESHVARYAIKYWIDHYNLPFEEKEIVEAVSSPIALFEDYKPAVNALRSKVDRIVLFTNSTGYVLKKKLAETGICEDFSKVYDVIGLWDHPKDTSEAYQKLLESEGCTPDEILHVGDSEKGDKLAPEQVGLRAVLIDRDGKGDIKSLQELTELVR